jgi:hypothetical protein
VAPPLPDARREPSCHPTPPRPGPRTSGPPRCAGGWAGARKVRAPPRAGPHGRPPRESESLGARGGQGLGGGAGADPGTGAGHWRGHGWARPPPSSQPETEARPWGSVSAGVRARGLRGARGEGGGGWGPGSGGAGVQIAEQFGRKAGDRAGTGAERGSGGGGGEGDRDCGGEWEVTGRRKPLWGPGATCPSIQETCGVTAVCLKRRGCGALREAPPLFNLEPRTPWSLCGVSGNREIASPWRPEYPHRGGPLCPSAPAGAMRVTPVEDGQDGAGFS